MALTIAQIEDAIIAALQASDLADVCKTIDTYGGEIEDLMREVATLIIPLPAVFVLYMGSKLSEPANRSYDDELTFGLVAITKSLRGRADLRTGMYEILEILKTKGLLIDNNLGLEPKIEPLKPDTIEVILATKIFYAYRFDLKTSQSIDI